MHLPEPFGPIDPGWERALAPVSADLVRILGELGAEVARGDSYFPAAPQVLRAFQFPFEEVRVLVVGQDPYPTPGHAMGLAFSAAGATSPVPASLRNIFKELVADVGAPLPASCDLTPWAEQGVLLLNRVLTVGAGGGGAGRGVGGAGSHRGRGWEAVTQRAVEALVERGGPLVAVLWGKDAQSLRGVLGDVPVVASVHPSPLSAYRGFFGSRPFSQVNELLLAQGGDPIDWTLPGDAAGGLAGGLSSEADGRLAASARGPDELPLWD